MQSLDQCDKAAFNPSSTPFEGRATVISLQPGAADHPSSPPVLSLNGVWDLAEGGTESERLAERWPDAIPADVPGSVHTALMNAGRIPDPYVGKNDEIARAESFKTWWMKRTFMCPEGVAEASLTFDGICDACTVWLNGRRLGTHRGMFADLTFQVEPYLVDGENTLVVRLEPAPLRISDNEPNPFFTGMNVGWLDTAVINNIYGWHYIDLPSLGIWRSVRIEGRPSDRIEDPFIAATETEGGTARLYLTLAGEKRGRLAGTIEPENFEGPVHHFSHAVHATENPLLLEFTIPEARRWWPVDLGDPDLYRIRLSFIPDGDGIPDHTHFVFGLRTIDMQPLPEGPKADTYNWTFVVNGEPLFVKGANWCTMDALLRFEPARYARFMSLARDAHIQLLRAWGSGMPETDAFYDLADRMGIMVIQEWPTAWNSHQVQPYDILEETVRYNTIRLRNHPALVMWGGGNESDDPSGPAIDMMGRLSYELDGTRPFHRGEPWGGSIHNYDVYWGRQPLDRNLRLTAPFIGEFGLASAPDEKSMRRCLPEAEQTLWPPTADGSLFHRTPVFNKKGDMATLTRYAADFTPLTSLSHFITGTQLAQAVGIRHTLERARTRRPETTGILYYKLNDNNPAISWSTVDWYGTPKPAYHILRQAFRPLHVCVLFDQLSSIGEPLSLPVYLLDDADALAGTSWQAVVRAFNAELDQVARAEFAGQGAAGRVKKLGIFELSPDQTQSIPLLIVSEIRAGQSMLRTFYWINYTGIQGCLFRLPETRLALTAGPDRLTVENTDERPAVAVHFVSETGQDAFQCDDSFFWMDPGEHRDIAVNQTGDVNAVAWNAEPAG